MRRLPLAAIVCAVVALPFAVPSARTAQLATVGAYLIAIVGLDLLLTSGRLSLGQGAFAAVGAYTTASLVAHHGVRDLWTIPLAAVLCGVLGAALAMPTLRLGSFYPALVTFEVAVAVPVAIRHFGHFTGGSAGLSFVGARGRTAATGVTMLGVHVSSGRYAYFLTWAVAALLAWLAARLLAGRLGRALRAVRDGELPAAAAGVDARVVRAAAEGLAAAYGGAAGALLAIGSAQVDPGEFTLRLSLVLLAGAVVAGYGSLVLAPVGALVVEYAPGLVGRLGAGAGASGAGAFVLGALLVAAALLSPFGPRLADRRARESRRREEPGT